jgi:large subunit ribosomal protein L4
MKLDIYTQQGKKSTKKADVPDSVFKTQPNLELLSQYVYVYLANQRAAIAHTKDKGEVRGGGRKPWRQKGTGRARHGSIRSPIWTGGGVTFGPTNMRNWKKKLTKKMKISALRSALSSLVSDDKIKIVDKLSFKDKQLAAQATKFLEALKVPKKALVITPAKDESVMNAFSNLRNVKVVQMGELNVYDLLTGGDIIFLADALTHLEKYA